MKLSTRINLPHTLLSLKKKIQRIVQPTWVNLNIKLIFIIQSCFVIESACTVGILLFHRYLTDIHRVPKRSTGKSLYAYSPWCVWCCECSILIQPLMCMLLCRLYNKYSSWCVCCCAGSIWLQPLMCLVLCRFYAGHHQGQDAHRQLYDEGQYAKLRISEWLCILSYITPENTDLPSGSMFSQSSLIRVEKSELCRLSSVTNRGRTGSHRLSTLDTAHAWFTMVSPGLTVERRIMKSYCDVKELTGVVSPTQCDPIIKNHF